jgi:prepilin-type N-terminal cleavage/methylation domain-containing protein
MKKTVSLKSGFTLLEILLVVGIISILAGIVILAINPTKQLGDTRNAQRRADVLTIINAVYQYSLDNGSLPTSIPEVSTSCAEDAAAEICQEEDGTETCSSLVALYDDLVTASSTYLSAIPKDPSETVSYGSGSGYAVVEEDSGRITVCAPSAENDVTISVTR